MHHQRHQRTLPRSRQRDEHQRALRRVRVVLNGPYARALRRGEAIASEGGGLQYRGQTGFNDRIREPGHTRQEDGSVGRD